MRSVVLFIVSVLVLSACGQTCRNFAEFTLFPNPVVVGQTVHLRAEIPLLIKQGAITGGTLSISVKLNDVDIITFNQLALCNISSSIVCSSLGVGNNAINIDLPVPKIPAGTYTAVINTTLLPINQIYCTTVSLVVQDPDQTNKGYLSFFAATLLGVAQFQNPNVLSRALNDLVQVGPVGPAPAVTASTFPWGTFVSLEGSEDTILPYTSTAGFVWGLYGNIVEIAYSTTKRIHSYKGYFQVGYVSDLSKREMDKELLDGDFSLSWEFDSSLNSVLTGKIHFNDPYGIIPAGWNEPITVSRFGSLDVTTTENGVLMVSANKTYCPAGVTCTTNSAPIIAPTPSGLSSRDVGLIVGLVVGIPIMVALAIIAFFWRRHRRHYEEEQGIFNYARKPEYGNALVVDDIIQESREQGSPELIPPLNRRGDDTQSDYSDDDDISDDESELEPPSRSRFGGNADVGRGRRSVSPPPRRSRSPPRRSRSPPPRYARSRSPSVRGRRSRSNSRERRSVSRGRDVSDSYYSDAGSSASRISASDEE